MENKFVRYTVAISLIILGVLGMLLPLAPGLIFFVPGLYLLNEKWVKKHLKGLKEKYRQYKNRKEKK